MLTLLFVESSLRPPQYPSTLLRFHGLVVQVALSKVHAVSKDYRFQVGLSSELQEHVVIAGRWRAILPSSSHLFGIIPFPASTAGTHRMLLLTDVILDHVYCFRQGALFDLSPPALPPLLLLLWCFLVFGNVSQDQRGAWTDVVAFDFDSLSLTFGDINKVNALRKPVSDSGCAPLSLVAHSSVRFFTFRIQFLFVLLLAMFRQLPFLQYRRCP